jgi:hypothetical protein
MQSEVLPSEVQFVAPSTIPQARSYVFKQQSELQEYDLSKGNRIRINIPRLQRSYLMKDSYIRFRLNLDLTHAKAVPGQVWLDRCGAHGLFDRIEVYDYLGGTLIEQTQNIPALITCLGDLTYDLMKYNVDLQTTQGYSGSNVQAKVTEYDGYEVRTNNTGLILYNKGADANNPTNSFVTWEFCLPVLSFLGVFSDKYTPLHNGFSVDFYLNSPDLALVSRAVTIDDSTPSTTSTNISCTIVNSWISNFEYVCQVLELGEQAESMVTAQEPLVIPTSQYRYFTDIILGSGVQSNFRLDLNLNVVSLKNIMWGMRPTVYQGLAYPSYGHRMRNFLYNWNFQYGSSYLPEIAGISCRSQTLPSSRSGFTLYEGLSTNAGWSKAAGYNQSYMELQKLHDANVVGGINATEYMIDTAAQSGTSDFSGALSGTGALIPCFGPGTKTICGKFLAGLDTRLSKKNAISGIDTNGLLVSVNGYFDTDYVSSVQQAILDLWAQYDAFVQVIPGVATTVTF